MSNSCDYLFKIVMVGDADVGKSSLLMRFADNVFSGNYITTIGIDFKSRLVNIQDKIVNLQIWDTAGQERFRSITACYYNAADAIIICYDITNLSSFNQIESWLDELESKARHDVIKLIVGNKADDIEHRAVSIEMLQDLAQRNNCDFIETSAKEALNVDLVFLNMGTKLMEKKQKLMNRHLSTVDLNNSIVKKNEKSKCCK